MHKNTKISSTWVTIIYVFSTILFLCSVKQVVLFISLIFLGRQLYNVAKCSFSKCVRLHFLQRGQLKWWFIWGPYKSCWSVKIQDIIKIIRDLSSFIFLRFTNDFVFISLFHQKQKGIIVGRDRIKCHCPANYLCSCILN